MRVVLDEARVGALVTLAHVVRRFFGDTVESAFDAGECRARRGNWRTRPHGGAELRDFAVERAGERLDDRL
jgi:hypothetical protein